MNPSIENRQTFRLVTLISTLLLGACSSSSDSSGSSTLMNPAAIEASQNVALPLIEGTVTTDVEDPMTTDIEASMTTDVEDSVTTDIDASMATDIEGSITSDPITPSLTRVDFEITVPAYMSNSLQVDLTWGEQTIPVQWVGDELWSASGELLSNTNNLLVVTFLDNNGAITLGRVENNFTTGMNSAQSLQISAEQFDTSAWDTDNDGISNLDESIAGTNPLLDESALLDVRESLNFSPIGNFSISFYESRIPEERPYFEHLEESVNCCTTRTTTIDIDASGTGTYFIESIQTQNSDTTRNQDSGARTVSENSIEWIGTSSWFNSGAAVGSNSDFNYTTTLLDGSQRSIVGSLFLNSQGTANPSDSRIEFSLIGEVIEGTQRCAPVSGTVSREYFRAGNEILAASKEINDRYWSVNSRTGEEYFVNDIGTTFQCVFTDWE